MPKLSPRCPAASVLSGNDPQAAGIICGVLSRDHVEDHLVNKETEDWHVFRLRGDAKTVLGHCCARYEECMIWRADKKRIEEQQRQLRQAA